MISIYARATDTAEHPVEIMVDEGRTAIRLTRDEAIRLASNLLAITLKAPPLEPAE
jgi:hypothetical protein